MKRLLSLLVTLVAALLCAAPAATAVPTAPVLSYTYDAPTCIAPGNDIVYERGPPAGGYTDNTHSAVGSQPLGDSARLSASATCPAYHYDGTALLVQADSTAGTTRAPARMIRAGLSSLQRRHVAANTAEEGTTLFRGVASDHHAFQEALSGEAWPGDVLGHENGSWHAGGFTEDSSLTSWTTDRAVAERFATKQGATNGVILRTTLEEQAGRGVPGPNNLGESEVLLRGVIRGLPVENVP